GTTRAFAPHSEFFNSQGSLTTQVNGVSSMGNNVQFEGVDNNQRTGLLTMMVPPVEGTSDGGCDNEQLRGGTRSRRRCCDEHHPEIGHKQPARRRIRIHNNSSL